MILLLGIAIAIVCLFTYLPMTDLPEHMLIGKILVSYDDPRFGFSEHFTKHFLWAPYSTYFWFASAAGVVLGIPAVTKIYLALTFLLTIAGYSFWIRTVAPDRTPNVVAAIPLLFGTFFYIGMIQFLFSVAFLFVALGLGPVAVSHDRRFRDVAGLAAALLLVWFSHPVTFGLAVGALVIQALSLGAPHVRQALYVCGLAISAALIYSVFALPEYISSFGPLYDPLGVRATAFAMPFGAFWDPGIATWKYQSVMLGYWGIFIVCSVVGLFMSRKDGKATALKASTILVAGALAAAVLLLPSNISNGPPISMRASYPGAFALLALMPACWYRQRVLRAVVIAACLGVLAITGARIQLFQTEMHELEQAIAAIPPRQRVQPIITELHSRHFETYPFLHAAALYNASRGGYSPYLFTRQSHFPVRERSDVIPNAPGEWGMSEFQYALHGAGTDYFLVKTRKREIIEDLSHHMPRVGEFGPWQVFGPSER